MMFTGRDSVEKYGELLAWDKYSQAFDWMQSGRGVHPGEGILVMETSIVSCWIVLWR